MRTATLTSLIATFFALPTFSQYVIAPDTVDQSTRDAWCLSQQTQCPLICLQTPANSAQTNSNDCNSTLLTYSCVCSNGLSPNVSEYSQTLPFYICQEWGNQCVSNCGSDNTCSNNCRVNHPCGAQAPTRANISTVTVSPSASTTSGLASDIVYKGFGSSATAPPTGSSAASSIRVAALSVGQTFGTLTVIGALFAGFAVML